VSKPQRVAVAVFEAGILYFGFYFALVEFLALNLDLNPSLPWWVIADLVLAATMFPLARRLGCYPMLPNPPAYSGWAVTVGCGVISIVAAELAYASLFPMRIGLLSMPQAGLPLNISYALLMPLFGAFLEEICFRGILQGQLSTAVRPGIALVAAMLCFLLAHAPTGQVNQIVLYVGVSLACGIFTWRSCSLAPAIATHIMVNASFVALPIMGLAKPYNIPGYVILIELVTAATFAFFCARRIAQPWSYSPTTDRSTNS
jgi:membrane protease YdiL (CAAX protease family)